MIWFLVAACSGPDGVVGTVPDRTAETSDTSETHSHTGSTTDTDTGPHTGPSQSVRDAVERAGFDVGVGALVFSTMEGCCDPGANCWGNNPSTPYGAYAVPPAPGQPVRADTLLNDFGPVPDGLSRDFLMRPDEALVWLGTMPPKAKYFGFRSSLAVRPGFDPVIGSLGAATNHLTVEAARGGEAWEQPVAVVTTGDADIEARAIEALVAGGWNPAHIVTDRMAPVVHLGLNPAVHDSLFTTMRVAVYDDPLAGAAWQESPGVVWRLTPTSGSPANPHPMPDLLERGSGSTEQAWAEARSALEAALVDRFAGDTSSEVQRIFPYWRETLECIELNDSCTGDIRDRYVGLSPYFALPMQADFLVAWGVNHEVTGKSSYASVSVQTIESQRGIESVDSRRMLGSARPYLDHPLVDDLYVVVFARDCAPFEGVCVEVPWTCPGGGADELLKITGRAYLEPTTGAAPVPEELEVDSVLLVWPR